MKPLKPIQFLKENYLPLLVIAGQLLGAKLCGII